MKKKSIFLTLCVVMLLCLVGCGNKKEFNGKWLKFENTSIKPDYIEKKKTDGELWFAFDYRNDFSKVESVGFISKSINISAFQAGKELKLSQKTEDDFSDNLSSVYKKVAKGEESFIIYIFDTNNFDDPVTFVFSELEGKSEKETIDLN